MPQGPALVAYNNVMRVPIQMGEMGVATGRNIANNVDHVMSGNPFRIMSIFLPNGQNTGGQNTAAQNPGGNLLTQAQGMANSAMGFANNMAQQSTAAATNAMGQGMQAANSAMGLMGNMAQQGAQTAQDLLSSTMQGFQAFVPRFF